MARPVVIVTDGTAPGFVQTTDGPPATPVENGFGAPIQLVDSGGPAICLVNDDGSAWSGSTYVTNLIIDTDYSGDCDDALALSLAIKAHQDELFTLSVVVSSDIDTAAPAVRATLDTYGLTEVPVYAYQGTVGNYNNNFTASVRNRFRNSTDVRSNYTDDVTGYRTLLANAADASVKIVALGGLTALSRLLDSPADSISPLTGSELIAAKVTSLVSMAGTFPTSSGTPEYNMAQDPTGSQNVCDNWPTPIIFHGSEVGGTIATGPWVYTDQFLDPIKYAYDLYQVNVGGMSGSAFQTGLKRFAWDSVAMYYALYGAGTSFGMGGSNGTVTIDGSGNNSWSASPVGTRSYVNKSVADSVILALVESKQAYLAPPDASQFLIELDEGTGEYSEDATAPSVRAFRGGSPITGQGQDPTWLDLGTNQWCLDFDGGDGLTIQEHAGFNSTDIFVGALVRFDSVTSTRVIVAREDGAAPKRHWNLRNNAGKLEFVGTTSGGTSYTVTPSTTDLTTATWYMVSALVVGTSVKLRKNGSEIHSGTITAAINNTSSKARVMIGSRLNSSNIGTDFLDGRIAGVVFKAGASASDVATLEAQLTALATAKGITL